MLNVKSCVQGQLLAFSNFYPFEGLGKKSIETLMNNIPNLNEQLFLRDALTVTSGKASSIIDSFSGWMLGGFGVASALFVSNYDSISKHICPAVIHHFLVLFLWTLVLGIFEKYFSMLIRSHAAGHAIGCKNVEKLGDKVADLNFEFIIRETEKAIFPFLRWVVRGSFAKVKKGDLISTSQKYTRLAQWQGVFVLFQAFLILYAVYTLASSFTA